MVLTLITGGASLKFPETSFVLAGLDIKGRTRMKAFPSRQRRLVFALALFATAVITTNAWAGGPTISMSVFPAMITNEGQDAAFTLNLSSPTSRKIAVHFVMTGLADFSDYALIGNINFGRVVIPAGQSSATVVLHTLNGQRGPTVATAIFNIFGGDHYRVGHPSNATLKIQNLQ
jgi:hypothetical protein